MSQKGCGRDQKADPDPAPGLPALQPLPTCLTSPSHESGIKHAPGPPAVAREKPPPVSVHGRAPRVSNVTLLWALTAFGEEKKQVLSWVLGPCCL